jgi:hypothetical protein
MYEVSMVACNDNYKIGSWLAKALNEFDMPYGGINMIFSGDFAQMPPVFLWFWPLSLTCVCSP